MLNCSGFVFTATRGGTIKFPCYLCHHDLIAWCQTCCCKIVYSWFLINWGIGLTTFSWTSIFYQVHKASCIHHFPIWYKLCLPNVFVGFQRWFAQKGYRSQGMKVFFGGMPQTPVRLHTLHAIVHSSINTITCFTVTTFIYIYSLVSM